MAKNDILTEMVTMRLREDAAAAYRGKIPAVRREIMQLLRERLDEILSLTGSEGSSDSITETGAGEKPDVAPSSSPETHVTTGFIWIQESHPTSQ